MEGWAEEILLPSIANAIGINLTQKGVSVVNIGHTGFDHYAKIYLRQSEPNMTIPISVITDSDIREYEKQLKLDGAGKPLKNANGKDEYDYIKKDVQKKTEAKLATLYGKSEINVQYFPAPNWTLEYSLFKSASLTTIFKTIVEAVHTGTNWDDFEKTLAEKLINKGLNKTEIAYKMATAIDDDLNKDVRTILNVDDTTDTVNYLVQAIKYATGN